MFYVPQVMEDIGGTARLENTKVYSALLAKQSADAAAFRSAATPDPLINFTMHF